MWLTNQVRSRSDFCRFIVHKITRMKNAFLLILIAISAPAFCQSEQVRKNHFNLKKTVALEGYDPVSYFDGRPEEGEEKISYTYKGVIYYFRTNASLARFKASPEKFEPAYGGWCAYAMGDTGEKVKIDPETFKIVDGRLYLFYNFWGNNTLEDWNQDERKLKENADRNWAVAIK